MKLRTYEEIVEKLQEVMKEDMLGWNTPDYVVYLPFKYAKEYLNDGVTEEEWHKSYKGYTLENVLKEMEDYLEFAFDKAEGERGISANRSMDHYRNWFWLIGEDEMSSNVWGNYHSYGLPKLREIKEWLEEKC